MKRIVILTVGKTHSGKTTFAREIEQSVPDFTVIDRDDISEFINKNYRSLLPQQGANTLKDTITRTIVDYAVRESNHHLILSNANRNREGRLNMLDWFHQQGFVSVLVYFNIPDEILYSRIADSQRSTAIFRSAASFGEVLNRQIAASVNGEAHPPAESESEHQFVINDSCEVQSVIQKITAIAHR